MLQEIILYIRENMMFVACAAFGVTMLLLLIILIQVGRTRREVHKICKKVRKYFEVILSEDESEEQKKTAQPEVAVEEVPLPVYQTQKEQLMQQEEEKRERDAKILMDVISEVF